MKFFAILAAVLLERWGSEWRALRNPELFTRYGRAMRVLLSGELFNGTLGLLVALAPAFMLVSWLQGLLSRGVWSVLGLVFAIAVLLASSGRYRIARLLDGYVEATQARDERRAFDCAEALTGGAVPLDAEPRHRSLVTAALAGIGDSWPAVLFWFALLGPVGPVMFRLVCVFRDGVDDRADSDGFVAAARGLHAILVWVPARLTVLAYALTGSFVDVTRSWREAAQRTAGDALYQTPRILVAAGLGALQLDREGAAFTLDAVQSARDLLQRAAWVWVAAFALLTLLGMMR